MVGAAQRRIEESIHFVYTKSDHTAVKVAASNRNKQFTFELQVDVLGKLSPIDCLSLMNNLGARDGARLRVSNSLVGMRMRHIDMYNNAEGIFSRKNIARVKGALTNIRSYEAEILEAVEFDDDAIDAGANGHEHESEEGD